MRMITQSDPTAYWWTYFEWNKYGKPTGSPCPLCEFTLWTKQEMSFQSPLMGASDKHQIFYLAKGHEMGEWHEDGLNKYSGWFKMNSFPNFDGNITVLEGTWNNWGTGYGEPGKFRLVRGRLKADEERRLLK